MNNLAKNTKKVAESFKPDFSKIEPVDLKTFVEKNIFYTILVIVVVMIGYYLYIAYVNWETTPIKKIKPSLKIGMIPDGKPFITENKDMDCPFNLSKYSFTFGLNINDFFCNRGFWKCIMLKGNEMKETYKNNKCSDNKPKSLGKNMDNCFIYEDGKENRCHKILEDYKGSSEYGNLKKLKEIIEGLKYEGEKKGLKILDPNSLYKRLDLICKAFKIPENVGKELLCCAVSECGFFKDENGEPFKLTRGQCMKFLDQHDDYCGKVYQTEKKVSRNTENNFEKGDERFFYDDYDNICSAENLRQKYPELLPETIERNGEIELINLANKNNMDISNPNPDTDFIEGCYAKDDNIFLDRKRYINTREGSYTVQECNRMAIEKGYTHFAVETTNSSVDTGNCLLIRESGKDILRKSQNLEHQECGNDNSPDYRLGNPIGDNPSVYVSRARKPEDLVVIKCWEEVVNNFPHQNPGIWLHPYVNNIRICLTTHSDTDYNDLKNDIIHPHKKTHKYNYNIQEIKEKTEHAEVEEKTEPSKCPKTNEIKKKQKFLYREYFDIENIPIQEEFHLALVINDKTAEVYINAKLTTSMILFGNPYYNDGTLTVNPQETGTIKNDKDVKLKLGGVVSNFKYYPYVIDSNNIIILMNETIGYQNTGQKIMKSSKEHNHSVSLSHEHKYDTEEEGEHKHIVNDDDINQGYYLEN